MTNIQNIKLIIVDDELSVLNSLKRTLRLQPVAITACTTGLEALQIMQQESFDILVSDMRMEGMDGAELLERVRHKWPLTRRILLTGFADLNSTISAINKGQIHAYLEKPWDRTKLLATLEEQFKLHGKSQNTEDRAKLANKVYKQNKSLGEKHLHYKKALKSAKHFSSLARNQLEKDHAAMITLVEQITRINHPEVEPLLDRIVELKDEVIEIAQLSDECNKVLNSAIKLFPIGLLFTLTEPSSKDPFSFQQAELMLAGVSHLSSAGTILNLSRERFDGTGPNGIKGEHIPKVARAFSAMLFWAQGSLKYDDVEALTVWLNQYGQGYIDPQILENITEIILRNSQSPRMKVRLVHQTKLAPGMIVVNDIRDEDNLLLLAKGTQLTESLVETLIVYDWYHHTDHEIAVFDPTQPTE